MSNLTPALAECRGVSEQCPTPSTLPPIGKSGQAGTGTVCSGWEQEIISKVVQVVDADYFCRRSDNQIKTKELYIIFSNESEQ